MSDFAGYLLKVGNTVVPSRYIKPNTYKTTANQREEIEAYRDDSTRALTRVTAPGHVTKIEFETVDNMELANVKAFFNTFRNAFSNTNQRKITLTYFNMEDFTYKSSAFYMPDIEYTIRRISGTKMYFEPFRLAFIEYAPLTATTV